MEAREGFALEPHGRGWVSVEFEIAGLPVVRDPDDNEAVFATLAAVELELNGVVRRVTVEGNPVIGGPRRGPDWVIWGPGDMPGAGRVVLAAVEAARELWRQGAIAETGTPSAG